MLPTVTGEFRVATDPELRFTPSGMAVCKMRAVTSSRKEEPKGSGNWVDDKQCWVTITCFKQMAENMAESFEKGHLVTVTGRLQTEDWEDKDGGKRTTIELVPYHLGHSITWDASKTVKAQTQRESSAQRSSSPSEDPWAVSPGGGGSQSDEPPF
jgi:single-strand DNA-binding protein